MQSIEVKKRRNPNLQKTLKEETGKERKREWELWREDLQLSEVKAGPSRMLTMWVRTLGGRAEMVVALLDSPDLGVVQVMGSVDEGEIGREREV